MTTVLVQAGRHGGYVFLPKQTAPLLSARARQLGLQSKEDVEREYADQTAYHGGLEGWSAGAKHTESALDVLYHCPFCDADFWSPSGARKHMKAQGHPVLRWDWYGEVAQ